MVIVQHRSRRKVSGGRYRAARGKRQFESGNVPAMTTMGVHKVKKYRTLGGHTKIRVVTTPAVNVYDAASKKCVKAVMKNVVDNPASKFFVRRNILTQGAVVETDKGKVRITSRPGQDGNVNGVFVK
ncbi:30S ribosomal protein S8e [Candidatus Woesearchaeota archaeon]|nr:30S ribosomal protein S8e [Candidatus Woesearchaeota archaeon]